VPDSVSHKEVPLARGLLATTAGSAIYIHAADAYYESPAEASRRAT
jgi:hypothetical protein